MRRLPCKWKRLGWVTALSQILLAEMPKFQDAAVFCRFFVEKIPLVVWGSAETCSGTQFALENTDQEDETDHREQCLQEQQAV